MKAPRSWSRTSNSLLFCYLPTRNKIFMWTSRRRWPAKEARRKIQERKFNLKPLCAHPTTTPNGRKSISKGKANSINGPCCNCFCSWRRSRLRWANQSRAKNSWITDFHSWIFPWTKILAALDLTLSRRARRLSAVAQASVWLNHWRFLDWSEWKLSVLSIYNLRRQSRLHFFYKRQAHRPKSTIGREIVSLLYKTKPTRNYDLLRKYQERVSRQLERYSLIRATSLKCQ